MIAIVRSAADLCGGAVRKQKQCRLHTEVGPGRPDSDYNHPGVPAVFLFVLAGSTALHAIAQSLFTKKTQPLHKRNSAALCSFKAYQLPQRLAPLLADGEAFGAVRIMRDSISRRMTVLRRSTLLGKPAAQYDIQRGDVAQRDHSGQNALAA